MLAVATIALLLSSGALLSTAGLLGFIANWLSLIHI